MAYHSQLPPVSDSTAHKVHPMWGSTLWTALHALSFTYPEKPTDAEKKNMADFIHALGRVLPCKTCQDHFQRTASLEYPIEKYLGSRETFARWLVDVHNMVNDRLGKPRMSFETAKGRYTASDETNAPGSAQIAQSAVENCSRNQNIWFAVILVLLLIMILLLALLLWRR